MMTEPQFRLHPQLRNELANLLKNSTFQEALAIVQDKAKPRSTPEPRPNAHLDTLVAHDFHYKRGIQAAIDTLDRLTKAPEIEEDQRLDEDPFSHSLPRELRDAINQYRQES